MINIFNYGLRRAKGIDDQQRPVATCHCGGPAAQPGNPAQQPTPTHTPAGPLSKTTRESIFHIHLKKIPSCNSHFSPLKRHTPCKATETPGPGRKGIARRHNVGQLNIRAFAAAIGLMILLQVLGAAPASGAEPTYPVDIPTQNVAKALTRLSEQTDVQVLFPYAIAEHKRANPVKGQYTLQQALNLLLQGTGLSGGLSNKGVLTISEKESDENHNERKEAMNTRKNLLAALVGLFVGAGGQSAMAADAGDQARKPERKKMVLEEITVTATKRETSLQDTAMSITALGSEEIDRRGLVGMGDYLNSVPGASVLDQTAGNTSIVLRGLAANADLDGNTSGPTVGVYFGDTPISGLATLGNHADIKLVDIERVEVLRGPQGTLYGSSNLGGTVRNIPIQPSLDQTEGKLEFAYSNTAKLGSNNNEVQGVVNIPIVDNKLAIRAVGYRFDNSGYYRSVGDNHPDIAAGVQAFGGTPAEGGNVGSSEYVGGRISVLWQASNDLTVNLLYLNQDIKQSGGPSSDLVVGTSEYLQRRFQVREVFDIGATNIVDLGVVTEPNFNESYEDKIEVANGTIEYDFSWGKLVSATSFVQETSEAGRDIGLFYFGGVPVTQTGENRAEAFFQEIRVVTELEGPLQLTAGLYFEDIELVNTFWNGFGGDLESNPFGNQIDLYVGADSKDTRQKAVFGELSYELINNLKVIAGARAFTYDRTVSGRLEQSVFSTKGTNITKSEDSDVNFKIGLENTPNEDTLLYATWSQGFRLGRPVAATFAPICDQDNDGIFDGSDGISTGVRKIDSDYVDSYEVGGKFTFLDNRLQINADIYQLNWEGIPVITVFETGCGTFLNAGKARSRGFEIEGSYYLGNSLLFNFGASYVNAELKKDTPSIGLAGERLPGSPEHNFNAGLQYEFLLANNEAFIRGDYQYVGGFYNNVQQTGQKLGNYAQLNMRFGIDLESLSLSVFAKNITNEDAYTWLLDIGGGVGYQLRPRTIGIDLGYRF